MLIKLRPLMIHKCTINARFLVAQSAIVQKMVHIQPVMAEKHKIGTFSKVIGVRDFRMPVLLTSKSLGYEQLNY